MQRHAWILAGCVSASVLFSAGLSHADLTGEYGGGEVEIPEPVRRGGFALGLNSNYGVGNFSGYRNKLQELGREEYRSEVSGSFYNGGTLWIGAAMRDWLTFGLGFGGGSAQDGDLLASGGGILVHIESFPLFSLGGLYEALGLLTEFGAGGATITDGNKDIVADGGNMSIINLGAFLEPWQWWHLSFGPSLTYSFMNSTSLTAHTVGLGFRATFYATAPDR